MRFVPSAGRFAAMTEISMQWTPGKLRRGGSLAVGRCLEQSKQKETENEKITSVCIPCIGCVNGFVQWVRFGFDTSPSYVYAFADQYTFTNKYTNSTHSHSNTHFGAKPYGHAHISPNRKFRWHLV
jgi:hypothetical protein